MEAGIGASNGKFYLFGATGNFQNLGGKEPAMDNILYGFIDVDYPFYKDLNGGKVPLGQDVTAFNARAHELANKARSIDNLSGALQVDPGVCLDVTGNDDDNSCLKVLNNQTAWVIGLDRGVAVPKNKVSNKADGVSPNLFRKASASPTLFKGKVYFPVYQPPQGVGCAQGSAFICVADDECGTNGSQQLDLENPPVELDVARAKGNVCGYVRQGVLSELVIFADQLFANVAGPSENEETLFQILSLPGDVLTNKGGWRDSSF